MKLRNALRENPVVVVVVVAGVAVVEAAGDHAAGKRQRVATLPKELRTRLLGTHHISLSCATTSTVVVSPAFRLSTPMLVRIEIFSSVSKTLSLMKRLLAPYTWASPFFPCWLTAYLSGAHRCNSLRARVMAT